MLKERIKENSMKGEAMTVTEMRKQVAAAYSGDEWKKKVAKMSDAQITAIYMRLRSQGKVN